MDNIASKDLLSDGDDIWTHCTLKCAKQANEVGANGCCEGSDLGPGYCMFYPNGTTHKAQGDTRSVLCKRKFLSKKG